MATPRGSLPGILTVASLILTLLAATVTSAASDSFEIAIVAFLLVASFRLQHCGGESTNIFVKLLESSRSVGIWSTYLFLSPPWWRAGRRTVRRLACL